MAWSASIILVAVCGVVVRVIWAEAYIHIYIYAAHEESVFVLFFRLPLENGKNETLIF